MNLLLLLFVGLKVISLVPSVTEIIYLLHADSVLVANTIYDDYPPAAKEKPRVGDLLHPKIDMIIKLKPDYIFVTLPMQKFVAQKLKKLGFKVVAVTPESIDGILETIKLVGKYTDHEARAQFVVDSLRAILDSLKRTMPHKRLKVYFELSPRPLYTAGGKSFINEIISLAGGKNIFERLKIAYPVVKQEDVIKANPDIIVLSYPDAKPSAVKRRIGWDKIQAVRRNCIFKVNSSLFNRPGPRVFKAIIELRKLIQGCIASKQP